ncbi:MAG: MobH family relaxase [[Actinobacillus] rossii]|nr:MobH family relaxase [[Actinobacillus] rossii]
MFKQILSKIKKTAKPTNQVTETAVLTINEPSEFNTPQTHQELLNTPLRQKQLTTIWQNVSMSPTLFDELYRHPIEKYAELVQLFPASESHHHSHLGGMLDHGLEVIAIATKLRQNYVLPPNAAPEEQAKQRDAWTATVIYAALIHDIGKITTDIEVIQKNEQRWFPWLGMLSQPYRFRYIETRDYNLHPTLGSFFLSYLVPQKALTWLGDFPQAFSALMYFASGHTDKAGILSEIIQKADQLSVTMALGGDIRKLSESPKVSFATQLQFALRDVISNYKLNATQTGSDGWLTEQGLWVMSKSTLDKIRATLTQQGISAPSSNGKLLDELQAHKLVQTTKENMAVWSAKVESHAGWNPQMTFTLLRISPILIWSDVNQRPPYFEGKVTIVDKNGNPIENAIETDTPSSSIINIENNNSQEITNEHSPDNANEFTVEINTELVNENTVETQISHSVDDITQDITLTESESSITEDSADSMDLMGNILNLFPIQNNPVSTETIITTEPVIKQNLNTEPAINETTAIQTVEPVNNEIQQHDISNTQKTHKTKNTEVTTDNSLGEKFISWLKQGISSGKLLMNRPNAMIHIVDDHLFLVTPNIFKSYTLEITGNTENSDWELVQKEFQRLELHKRQYIKEENDSRNIWVCSVVGQNKTSLLNGYLLPNTKEYIGSKLALNNHWLKLKGTKK